MPSPLKTFVISLRDQDGPTTVEEVRTGRKVRLASLRDTASQIERWLREARPGGQNRSDGPQ